MKRLLKRPFKAVWRWTRPLRRPIVSRYEAMIVRCCLAARPTHVCHVTTETGLIMDHLVRELVRLQKQVDHLQLTVEEMNPAEGRLSVVGGDSGRETLTRSAAS